jgi:threonine dehydrogenase-like Zn-dependent dehydrogenase
MLRGIRVIGVDLVPERLARSSSLGVETIDLQSEDVVGQVLDLTNGRGADAVIDAVGMEAHGSRVAETSQKAVGLLPDALARPLMLNAGVDRLGAFNLAIAVARRGATVSLSGVYVGAMDPIDLKTIFDKQLSLRMGQANVRSWTDEILPLAENDQDPLGLEGFATHHVPLEDAAKAYQMWQEKADGAIKMVFTP